jgi:NTP pyrophosphatase (non-canonical NTP hydrolase)
MDEVREEIADVMIYLIYICEGLRIDLIEAVEKKIQQNGEKYPVLKSKGNSKKYKDLD